jgi:hypothetical protein
MSRADHPGAAAIWTGSPVSGVYGKRSDGSPKVLATEVPSNLCEEKECWTKMRIKTREVKMAGEGAGGCECECVCAALTRQEQGR